MKKMQLGVLLLAPLMGASGVLAQSTGGFEGWPSEFEGERLLRLPITPREHRLLQGFPGRAGRFRAGDKELLFRWTPQITRLLSSVRAVFAADGFLLGETEQQTRGGGAERSCFSADKGLEALTICERVFDGRGKSWPDFGEWLREARSARSRPPWQAIAVIERRNPL